MRPYYHPGPPPLFRIVWQNGDMVLHGGQEIYAGEKLLYWHWKKKAVFLTVKIAEGNLLTILISLDMQHTKLLNVNQC